MLSIDGNMWCITNGIELASPRCRFGFGRTIRKACEKYPEYVDPWSFGINPDITPEYYKENKKGEPDAE